MNDHTLTVLEFDRLLELICQQAQSEPGMAIIRNLRPRRELTEIQVRRLTLRRHAGGPRLPGRTRACA